MNHNDLTTPTGSGQGPGATPEAAGRSSYADTAHLYDLTYHIQGKDYAAEADELAAQILDRCGEATSVLDVGCGTGHHLELLGAHFAERAGVDVSAEMLEVARGRLVGVELVEGDMRSFSLGRRFDAVVCLFSAVGYMADADELDAAVAQMAAHVAPGGVLVVDGWVRPQEWAPGGGVRAESGVVGDEALARFSRSRTDGRHTWLEMTTYHSTPAGITEHASTHLLTLFTDDEYRSAFERAGMRASAVPSPMPGRDRWIATWP